MTPIKLNSKDIHVPVSFSPTKDVVYPKLLARAKPNAILILCDSAVYVEYLWFAPTKSNVN